MNNADIQLIVRYNFDMNINWHTFDNLKYCRANYDKN